MLQVWPARSHRSILQQANPAASSTTCSSGGEQGSLEAGKRASLALVGPSPGNDLRVGLLHVDRLKNLFFDLDLLLPYLALKYVVSTFPPECAGLQKLKLQKKTYSFVSPEQFVLIDSLPSEDNVLLWMVNTSHRMLTTLHHWNKGVSTSLFHSKCLTVTKVQRKGNSVNHTILLQLPRGSVMLDMRTGEQRKLCHPLQVSEKK